MFNHQTHPYAAYVLRVWRDGATAPWRAVLECARTGEQHPFAHLADLYAFLDAETGTTRAPVLENEDTGVGENVKWENEK